MSVAVRRVLISGAITAGVAAAAVLAPVAFGPSLVPVAAAKDGLPGRYIVTLKEGRSLSAQVGQVRATPVHRYEGVLTGFAAKLSADQLDQLRRDPDVAAIEQDQMARKFDTQQAPLPWGLDRIDQRSRPLSKTYYYKTAGAGVTAYVIDSGVHTGLSQFGGRAQTSWIAPRLAGNASDCAQHGTHVAGTIGSTTYGVAKKAQIRSVKVLDCEGYAPYSDVIAAVNWVKLNAAKPAVANLSLGGPKSTALNTAVTELSQSGVFVSVAAGNGNASGAAVNACNVSPASAGWVMTVGATTSGDRRVTWSNYGGCVDIHAPGYGIWSTYPVSPYYANLSGTSMAAPHVAGAAALYQSYYGKATFPTIQQWMNKYAAYNKISGMTGSTPNRLLYKGWL